MKRIYFLICIFLLQQCIVAAQDFIDDFSDGDFSASPVWEGNTDNFIINPDLTLQLSGDCTSGGSNYLSAVFNSLDSVTWTFNVQYSFDPSSSNYAKVYLQSNSADLNGALNGYYLRIGGESGSSDAVEIYKQEGTTSTLVLRGIDGNAAVSPHLGIKVVRTNSAEWNLYVDISGGTDYILEASAIDDAINGGAFLGVVCNYTSTRCQSFYFDDFIAGPIFADFDAPVLQTVSVISPESLELLFNENVDLISAETITNYSVDAGVGNPINAVRDFSNPAKVILTFADEFPQEILLHLSVNNIADEAGNIMSLQTMEFIYINNGIFDVVINEIFADPSPVIGLPEAEYIELFNTTLFDISLQDWFLTDATGTTDAFPEIILPADSFIIVTDDSNADLFTTYGLVIGVNNFPSLNNDGDNLTLFSSEGIAIHNVQFTSAWYQNTIKESGGYSLEMIDVLNPCQGINNWIASNDLSGGTPGKVNSVAASNPDNISPMLLSVYPQSNDTLIVNFDEEVLSSTLFTTAFTIDNGIGNPVAIIVEGSIVNSVTLILSSPLISSILYTLSVSDISDCSGNIIMLGNTMQFGISEETLAGDIVINEVLFNPATGGYDYVELYNNSKKILDLSDLYIIELNIDDTSMISEFANVSVNGRLFFPGTYVLLTEDISNVAQQYNRNDISNFITVSGMPNYPDDAGIVLIQTKGFVNIDRLEYSDEWQFELLEDDDGVALERVSFSAPTQDANNWHSAAELIGYGTPGYQNSNYNAAVIADNLLQLEYSVFSPDGDGYQDLLMITYQTQAEGFVANIRIFDDAGRPLATILNNETLAREGFITWDGVYDDGRRAPMGIYFLYAEFFNLDGVVTKQRKKFTLIRKYE